MTGRFAKLGDNSTRLGSEYIGRCLRQCPGSRFVAFAIFLVWLAVESVNIRDAFVLRGPYIPSGTPTRILEGRIGVRSTIYTFWQARALASELTSKGQDPCGVPGPTWAASNIISLCALLAGCLLKPIGKRLEKSLSPAVKTGWSSISRRLAMLRTIVSRRQDPDLEMTLSIEQTVPQPLTDSSRPEYMQSTGSFHTARSVVQEESSSTSATGELVPNPPTPPYPARLLR